MPLSQLASKESNVAGLACLAGALILAATSPAHAYRTAADLPDIPDDQAVRWADVPVELELHQGRAHGLTLAALTPVVEEALQTWSEPSCSSATLTLASTNDPAEPLDRRNTIEWLADGWVERGYDPELPAVTDVEYEDDGTGFRIVEADMYLNAELFSWNLSGEIDEDSVDVRAVLTHEVGHVLGLLHPCELDPPKGTPRCTDELLEQGLTMLPTYDVRQANLDPDAVAGVCDLYPREAVTCPDGTCEMPPDSVTELDAGPPCGDAGAQCEVDAGAADSGCGMSDDACSDGGSCRATTCPAAPGDFGDTCKASPECASGLCLGATGEAPVCTRRCGGKAGGCPSGWNCFEVRSEAVCVPKLEDEGCSVAASLGSRRRSAGRGSLGVLGLAAGLAGAIVRSSRSRKRRRDDSR